MAKRTKLKTTRYDSADYLKSEKAIAAYLDAALEDGDPKVIRHALNTIARARGMSQIARDSGVTRESLYRAFSEDGNPEFTTILKVVRALGLRLHAREA